MKETQESIVVFLYHDRFGSFCAKNNIPADC